jgi:hypothetical protein
MSESKHNPMSTTYLAWPRIAVRIKGVDRFRRAEVGSVNVVSVR